MVGSNVGIPDLSTATSWPLFVLSVAANNLGSQNFCIDGTFTFDHTASSTLTITNCDIVLLSASTVLFESASNTVSYKIVSSDIHGLGSNSITYNGGSNIVDGSLVEDIDLFTQTTAGGINIQNGSTFTNTQSVFSNIFGVSHLDSEFNDASTKTTDIAFFVSNTNKYNRQLSTFLRSAIYLHGTGFYIGKFNEFNNFESCIRRIDNTGTSFYTLYDEESKYFDNGIDHTTVPNDSAQIFIEGPVDFLIDNCDFYEQLDYAIQIQRNPYKSIVNNSRFSTSQTGLRDLAEVLLSNNIQFIDNEYTGTVPATHVAVSSTLWVDASTNLYVSNTDSPTGYNGYGIYANLVDIAGIEYSEYGENDHGVTNEYSSNILMEENFLNNNSIAGLELIEINRAYYQCNDLVENEDGLNLSQTNTRLFIRGNSFYYNDRGLVYQANTSAPQQLNHGNLFYTNTLGAIFEGSPIPVVVAANAYYYDVSIPAEYPGTVTPASWFVSDTASSYTCILARPSERNADFETELTQILYLIDCAGEESTDGNCYANLMAAFDLIFLNQDLLLNEEVNTFYTQYVNSNIAQMPRSLDIMRTVNPAFTFQNEFTWPSDLLNITPQETTIIQDFLETTNLSLANYQASRQASISILETVIDNIDAAIEIEENYKSTLQWLLNALITLDSEGIDWETVETLATTCRKDAGPAADVARQISSIFRKVYPQADCATEIIPIPSMYNQVNESESYVYPNPAGSELTLVLPENSIGIEVLLTDALGRVVRTIKISNTSTKIDISQLKEGIYYMQPLKSTLPAVRFIKI